MLSYLIDTRGLAWPEQRHPVMRFEDPASMIRYAVCDLGFVYLRLPADSMMVSFNQHRIGLASKISAFYAISDMRPRRVVLVYGDGDQHAVEMLGDPARAINRMDEIVETTPRCSTPDVVIRRRAIDSLCGAARDQVASLLRIWNGCQRRWDAERRANLIAGELAEQAAIVRNPRGSQQLIIEHWGTGRNLLGMRWARLACGKEVEDQPFSKLGRQMAALYRRVIDDGQPRLQSVAATIPQSDGRLVRREYGRLLLPWQGGAQERYVLAVNLPARAAVARSARPVDRTRAEP